MVTVKRNVEKESIINLNHGRCVANGIQLTLSVVPGAIHPSICVFLAYVYPARMQGARKNWPDSLDGNLIISKLSCKLDY